MECDIHKGFDLPVTHAVCSSCEQTIATEIVAFGPCRVCGATYLPDGTPITAAQPMPVDRAQDALTGRS